MKQAIDTLSEYKPYRLVGLFNDFMYWDETTILCFDLTNGNKERIPIVLQHNWYNNLLKTTQDWRTIHSITSPAGSYDILSINKLNNKQ